jgi:hypothetical protein
MQIRYVEQRPQIIYAPQILMQVQNQSETVGTGLVGAQNAGVTFSFQECAGAVLARANDIGEKPSLLHSTM